MNVLSLFDGMSCGRIALDRAGIPVTTYYASEVDKYAQIVSQANYPDIIQLGDVTKWREWDIDWSSIDLLIGGSPCQGFSFAGKQLAFNDPRSKLFFVYVDILNHIRSVNPDVKFLLENVKMKKQSLDIISEFLGVEPVFINSALVSAQNRQRWYWANWEFDQPEDRGIVLADIAHRKNIGRVNLSESTYTVRCKKQIIKNSKLLNQKAVALCSNSNMTGSGVNVIQFDDGMYRKLTPIECERLQTVPDNYTNHVSNTQRYRMLGNGWTVDVIAHIFSSMK